MNPTFLLIRHAETLLNKPGEERIRGRLDVPPSEKGLASFEKRAAKFAAAYPIRKIYTSPMLRAQETAHILADHAHPARGVDKYDTLLPWDNGDFQGRLVREVAADLQWYEMHPGDAVPGGESFRTFVDRLLQGIRSMLCATGAHRCSAAVTHSRNIDVICAWQAAGMKGTRLDAKTLLRTDHARTGDGFVFTWNGRSWAKNENPLGGTS